jgi:arsenate reductase (thioredoxin)
MLNSISNKIKGFDYSSISSSRKKELRLFSEYLANRLKNNQDIKLIFVCTHNSRRSQFTQVWASVAASYFNLPIFSFSAGTEVTEANERTISSLQRLGFVVSNGKEKNPLYRVSFDEFKNEILLFSKDLSHSSLPSENFAAIMTCSHADENCPFIPNCEAIIPLRYKDPKVFDDTELEKEKYDERALEIGTEIFYVFSQLTLNND